MTPVFEIFDLIGSIFYTSTQSDWPPFSAEKIGLSLSHLVPEILGPKIGGIFSKMYYLTDLKHFVSISLHFRSNWPPFPLILNFLTPHFYKSLDPIGSIFVHVLYLGTENFMKYPPKTTPLDILNEYTTAVPSTWREPVLFYTCLTKT